VDVDRLQRLAARPLDEDDPAGRRPANLSVMHGVPRGAARRPRRRHARRRDAGRGFPPRNVDRPAGDVSRPPSVSVVTCVYNGGRRLAHAIESVLAQTFGGFEYLIVDDGSGDDTAAVAAAFAARDRRIRLLRDDVNRGIGAAFNRAVAAAAGDLLVVQDHDDLSHPSRLEHFVALFTRRQAVGVAGSHVVVAGLDGGVAGVYRPPSGALRLRWESLFRCAVPFHAAAFRREAVARAGGASAAFSVSADYELLTRMMRSVDADVVPHELVTYRTHPAQTTRTRGERAHREAVLATATWWHYWLDCPASLGDVDVVYRAFNGLAAAPAEASRACAIVDDLLSRVIAREAVSDADRAYLSASVAAKRAAAGVT
jgi:Glycosyl transferase family 2